MSDRHEKPILPLDPRESRKRRRELAAIFALCVAFVGLTFLEFRLTESSHNLPFATSIFFFGLINLNIVILIFLMWLIFRNIGKLFLERRSRLLGASLKTKLVVAFLGFAIIPTLVLFFISSLYINSSFDKWFSLKVQNTLQASLEITRSYYRNADRVALHFADHLSNQISKKLSTASVENGFSKTIENELYDYITQQKNLLALDAIEIYVAPLEPRIIAQNQVKEHQFLTYPVLPVSLVQAALDGETASVIQHVEHGDLIRVLAPIRVSKPALAESFLLSAKPTVQIVGAVAVSSFIPVSLVNKVDEIANVLDDYKETNPLISPIKSTYFVILILITLVILFVAIWIGLYLARELTVPVERLVKAVQEVGAGNLAVRLEPAGQDEIAVLISSFNKMTRDLAESRTSLQRAGFDLEKRKAELETVLANIGAGVIAVDREGVITTFNRASEQILELDAQNCLGKRFSDIFLEGFQVLRDVIDNSLNNPNGATPGEKQAPEVAQWNLTQKDRTRSLTAISTPLFEGRTPVGAVIVIDDMTHLVKGQREMAWREVARRIAHEIKNPLTPIKLSAQRLQRRLAHLKGKDLHLLSECTETIVQHTDELKEMVNEFSNFARMPEISLSPNRLNEVISETVALFAQAHPKIRFTVMLENRIPVFEFDRDQIKRVLINLIDNAVSALQSLEENKPRSMTIESHYHDRLKIAAFSVRDSGPGMTEEIRSRVFEPYFSTKTDGTGLGLAIAKRIVNDHHGFIRVQSTPGKGTQFTIELPIETHLEKEKARSFERGTLQV